MTITAECALGECSRSHLSLKSGSPYSSVVGTAYKGSEGNKNGDTTITHEMQVKQLRLKLPCIPLCLQMFEALKKPHNKTAALKTTNLTEQKKPQQKPPLSKKPQKQTTKAMPRLKNPNQFQNFCFRFNYLQNGRHYLAYLCHIYLEEKAIYVTILSEFRNC